MSDRALRKVSVFLFALSLIGMGVAVSGANIGLAVVSGIGLAVAMIGWRTFHE